MFDQGFSDWEMLVYDSYSDDGAWEYIQSLAARDPRVRAWQGPREGTPGSWTPCLKEARGEYVYIATSDDTCALDFLEKTVAALDAHPECDVAHTPLHAIDENGDPHVKNDWWENRSLFARSTGELLRRPHVRMAPYDGLLHLLWGTVYISITQLLIRRSLFEKIGYFQQTWGWVGDFNWDMRAGLAANTVHVPDTWGGWRNHSSQATGGNVYGSEEHDAKIGLMIEDALAACREHLDDEVWAQVQETWLPARGGPSEVSAGEWSHRRVFSGARCLRLVRRWPVPPRREIMSPRSWVEKIGERMGLRSSNRGWKAGDPRFSWQAEAKSKGCLIATRNILSGKMSDELVIEPGRQRRQYGRDLWNYRELLYFLAWRDILVRYKQTIIGVAWAVLRPLLTMLILTVVFGKLAKMDSGGVPYPILVFCGMLPWQFFATALQESSNSLVNNAAMVSKVYFPRLIIPAASVVTSLVDFAISAGILVVMMIWYQFTPGWEVIFLPLFIALAFASSFGAGVWISALMVRYRDFRFIVPFMVQFGLYISPVGFMTSVVPDQWRLLYSLNPMVGVIDGFRWAILGNEHQMNWGGFALSAVMVVVITVSGIAYFRRTERTFADVI